MTIRILEGDCRTRLAELPDCSVHTCVTSPPYFGLRDYGVDGQMGLEPTPDEFVAGMVAVFAEVRRVLRDDGTLWLNIGDSYAGSWGARGRGEGTGAARPDLEAKHGTVAPNRNGFAPWGIKPKDRMMMPARLALALQADGWWLRDEIVWAKPNPMPSSVDDRTSPAHEMLYLLSKSARYFYDCDAIREPYSEGSADRYRYDMQGTAPASRQPNGDTGRKEREKGARSQNPLGRIKRSVWSIATESYAEAHFATYPPALIEPCILAGCPVGGTVLDPFFGAGTTGLVADRLQRDCIGIELNPEYTEIARKRLSKDGGMFAEVRAA